MFKRWVLLLMLLLSTQIQANATWTAWIYTAANGTMHSIGNDGQTLDTFALPLSQAFNTYGQTAVVSPSGRYTAYTMYDSTAITPNVQLAVYDRHLGSIRFTYDLSDADVFYTSSLAFDDARGRLAFGYHSDASGGHVVIGDFLTSSALATLSDHAAVQGNHAPNVHQYAQDAVIFSIGDAENRRAYRWQPEDDSVTEQDAYAAAYMDIDAATGQIVAATNDATLSQATSAGAVTVYNAVSVTNTQGQRTLLYHVDDGTIRDVAFIENGARVLVMVHRFAEDQLMLVVLNRDGTIAGELVGSLETLTGTPDGFVGMFSSNSSHALAYINTKAEALTPITLWSGAPGESAVLVAVH